MEETPLQKWQRTQRDAKEAFRQAHPRHRLITRGPRKGKIVRVTRAEFRKERSVAAASEKIVQTISASSETLLATGSLKSGDTDWSGLWYLLGVTGLSLFSTFAYLEIAQGLHAISLLAVLPLVVIADYTAWRLIAKAAPPTHKYFPFAWWILKIL